MTERACIIAKSKRFVKLTQAFLVIRGNILESAMPHSNYKILAIVYCLLAFFGIIVLFCFVRMNSILIMQSVNFKTHLRYHIANDNFRQGTDILTEAVRHYVATGKAEYMEEYFNEVQKDCHREKSLEMIHGLDVDQILKTCITNAMKASKRLMFTEYHAMHLIMDDSDNPTLHEEVSNFPLPYDEQQLSSLQRHTLAQELLWDESYVETKNEIYSYLAIGLENASISAMERHLNLRRELIKTLAIGSLNLIFLVMTVFGYILYRRYQRERKIEQQARENARMNIQLKKERDRSIKAEKAKSYFFSTVSHDIRTPLNAIIGFSEMLQLGIEDPEEKRKALDAIITSGQTLLELINDVLDLSKLEAGKMELHPEPTDIANLVGKVATSFEAATARTSLQLHTEVQKMPYLKLDPQRIRQILFNLIGNAVKFTSKGSVTIRASYNNGTFTLSVSDTGCGISEENIKKLMSPYVQLQDHDSNAGTGLGLAICKQLTTQMHGMLGITSTLGKGSTFTLIVPNVVAFSEKESETYINDHKRQQTAMQLDSSIAEKNILIVDDQKLNRSILRTMLSRLGLTKVLTAENGQEALETMRNNGNVDIVLTDMFMPVLDGEGLVQKIRANPEFRKIPVYVITADVEMQGKFKGMGFDNMLLKPITLEKLNNLLANCKPQKP